MYSETSTVHYNVYKFIALMSLYGVWMFVVLVFERHVTL